MTVDIQSHVAQKPIRNSQTVTPAGYPEDLDFDLDLTAAEFTNRLRDAAARYHNSTCLEYFGTRMSYRTLWQRVLQFADALQVMGLKSGDRVLIVLPNTPEAVIASLATLLSGGVLVMSNPLLSADEHAFQLQDSGARIVITLDLLAGRFSNLYCDCGAPSSQRQLQQVIACRLGDSMPWSKRLLGRLTGKLPHQRISRLKGVLDFHDALAVGKAAQYDIQPSKPDSTAVLIYTGGTTGKPKAVELTFANLNANISQIAAWLYFFEAGKTNVLGVFPLFSAAGLNALLLHTFVRGGTLALIPRPTPDAILAALKRLSIHVLPAVPTLFRGMLRDATFRREAPRHMKHIKLFLSGAAPLTDQLNAEWQQCFGDFIYELYGMTETTAMAFGNRPGSTIKSGSAGLPLPQLQCRIVDINDPQRVLGCGETGEICLQGPQIFARYFNNPEESAKVLRNGWLHTGDVGHLDAEGYLFISGRKKEMVISSGYNVYPVEIESVLSTLPGVLESACIGVADSYRGEAIKAFIVVDPSVALTTDSVIAHCNQYLARYKIPRDIAFVSELPKNPLGKILKQALQP